MPAQRRYPPELMERGVQMVLDLRRSSPSRSGIMREVGDLLGIHPEALRHWVKRAEGILASHATPEAGEAAPDRVEQLEQEIAHLRRANDILKAAALLFAAELEPHHQPRAS